jgi:hypothetical protein
MPYKIAGVSAIGLGWIISDPGVVQIIPTGLNFRPARDGSKRGYAEFLTNGIKEIRAYSGTT